jgi:hypothetical protein
MPQLAARNASTGKATARRTREQEGSASTHFRSRSAINRSSFASKTVHPIVDGAKLVLIQGLYCGGESAGGCSQHGQGRAITQGFIAGKEAALEKSPT